MLMLLTSKTFFKIHVLPERAQKPILDDTYIIYLNCGLQSNTEEYQMKLRIFVVFDRKGMSTWHCFLRFITFSFFGTAQQKLFR